MQEDAENIEQINKSKERTAGNASVSGRHLCQLTFLSGGALEKKSGDWLTSEQKNEPLKATTQHNTKHHNAFQTYWLLMTTKQTKHNKRRKTMNDIFIF